MQIPTPAICHNMTTGVSNASALGALSSMNLPPQLFPANVPGRSFSSSKNLVVMPNSNTLLHSLTNTCSLSSAVPLNPLSSTTSEVVRPSINSVIQSFPWHSGMSLHPYELVALPPRVQKCLAKNGGKMLHLVVKTLVFILMQNDVPMPGNYCTIASMQKLVPFLHSVQISHACMSQQLKST